MLNATGCYLRKDGRTLFICRNKDGDLFKGKYFPPGGHMERGERGIDCILREFDEETGLTILEPKLKVIATFYNEGRNLGEDKDPEDWQVEIYLAHNFKGTLSEEHPKARPVWVNDSDIKNLRIYPGDKRIIELLDKEGVFEVLARYSGDDLIEFKYERVA